MKIPTLGQFINAARSLTREVQLNEQVPYAFEKRIVANVIGRRVADLSNSIATAMWRAAFGCLVISVLTGAIVSFANPSATELFATDLERTVLAPVDVDDSW